MNSMIDCLIDLLAKVGKEIRTDDPILLQCISETLNQVRLEKAFK